jgi:hypothetical protein
MLVPQPQLQRIVPMISTTGTSKFVPLLLLLAGAGCAPGETVDCTYQARETRRNPSPDLQGFQPRGRCATLRSDGSLTVDREHLAEIAFTEGLGLIWVPAGWYYVTPAGRTAPVLTYDNGADPFEEGLARTTRGGKIGFVDRELTAVIPPTWDFAFPFAGGFAVVCDGCRRHPVGDEHTEMRGGTWGYIDRSGKVVVPIRYERDQLPPPPAR